MEDDWGEGDGGGAEAPGPPARPVEAGAVRAACPAAVRLEAAAIRRPAEAGREAWRLAEAAGRALVPAATGVAAGSAGCWLTGVAGLTEAVVAAPAMATGGWLAPVAAVGLGALVSGPLASGLAAAGWVTAAPGTALLAATDLAVDPVWGLRLVAIVQVG